MSTRQIIVRLVLLFLVALMAMAAGASAADRAVTVTWDPPTVFAGPGGDCANAGETIGPADQSRLQYEIRWRVGASGEWRYATTASTRYVIEAVPAGSTITVEVGAFLPGGSVGCWETATLTVPVPSVGPCQRLRLSTE